MPNVGPLSAPQLCHCSLIQLVCAVESVRWCVGVCVLVCARWFVRFGACEMGTWSCRGCVVACRLMPGCIRLRHHSTIALVCIRLHSTIALVCIRLHSTIVLVCIRLHSTIVLVCIRLRHHSTIALVCIRLRHHSRGTRESLAEEGKQFRMQHVETDLWLQCQLAEEQNEVSHCHTAASIKMALNLILSPCLLPICLVVLLVALIV